MAYGFQIKKAGDWLWVSTSCGQRYEFPTEYKADQAMRMSYPDQCIAQRFGAPVTVRVQEIPNDQQTT
jgi:hypothetical protein